MASDAIKAYRGTAVVHRGHEDCRKEIQNLLRDHDLPLGLLPLENIEELGFDRASKFIWIIQKKKVEHTFKKIKQQVAYDREMTGFIKTKRMWKLTGVKTKEFFVWLSITDVLANNADGGMTFATGSGLSRSFPVAAFALGE